jgi:hypothetical protein
MGRRRARGTGAHNGGEPTQDVIAAFEGRGSTLEVQRPINMNVTIPVTGQPHDEGIRKIVNTIDRYKRKITRGKG